MSPYLRSQTIRWSNPTNWSPVGILLGLILFVSLGSLSIVLLPAGYGPILICGILFFLFSLIRIEFGIYVMIFSMLLSPELSVGTTGQRSITLRVEDFMILALVLAWVLRGILMGQGVMFRQTPVNQPIYTYVFFALFSTLWGISLGFVEAKTALFYYMKVVEFFLIFFLTVSCIQDEQTLKRFLLFFLLTGVFIGAYGVLQIGHVDRISAPFEGDRPEPNTLGGYLTIILGLSFAFLIYTPRSLMHIRVLAILSVVLCFLTLLFTLSRASFIGFLFMLFGMGILSRKMILIYAVVAMLVFAPILLPKDVIERVNYTFSGPPENEITLFGAFTLSVDSSTMERINIWKKVGHSLLRSPLWGYGLTAQYILDSQFARLLVEVGVIGTGLFIWIIVRVFKCAWYLLHRSDSWYSRAVGLGYLAALGGMIVHSMGTITFYIVRIMEPFWLFTGIMVYLYLLEQKKNQSQPSPVKADRVEPRWIRPSSKGYSQ